jgi:hypothetical protein
MDIFWKVTDCPVPVFMALNEIPGSKAHNTSSVKKTKEDERRQMKTIRKLKEQRE